MAWRVARSITKLHEQFKRSAPRAAAGTPADAWGTIGDAAHDPTSDHSPHDFPGWGSDIVTAGDFPDVPALGLDARAALDAIRRSRDPRVKYGISHGQMFSSYATSSHPAWTWRPYSGKDGHFTHGHLSVVGDSRADGTQPWDIGGNDDMEQTEKVQGNKSRGNTVGDVLSDSSALRDFWYGRAGQEGPNPPAADSNAALIVKAARALLEGGTKPTPASVSLSTEDRAAIVADVTAAVVEQLTPKLADAIADQLAQRLSS